MDDLLRTGDAARILGTSRQHIVDLCDSGQIGHVRIGTHRRIPRSEMNRMTRAELTDEQTTTLRHHQALLTPLLTNPDDVLGNAKRNLTRAIGSRRDEAPCLKQWSRILHSDLDTIIDALVSTTPAACRLRADSPFVDVLPDTIRMERSANLMTTTLERRRQTVDPPELVEEPPRASEAPDATTCAHCPEPATVRFDGHDPASLLTQGQDRCQCPKPYTLCVRCYLGWHRWYSYKWYADGVVTCGYCGAQGNSIEALFPFLKI